MKQRLRSVEIVRHVESEPVSLYEIIWYLVRFGFGLDVWRWSSDNENEKGFFSC